MNKNNLYLIVIAGLLISNILTGYFLLVRENNKKPKPREIIIERLNFDENQIAQYDKMIQQHQNQIIDKEECMGKLKNELYSSLIYSESRTLTDSLSKEIGKIQEEIELIHYSHFEDIKKLCNKHQLEKFNKLINEIAELFSPITMKENERR